MKKNTILSLIFLINFSVGVLHAQSGISAGAPIPSEIENPEMLGINKEP